MAFVHQRSPHRPALVSAQTLDFLLPLVLDFAAYLALPFNFHDAFICCRFNYVNPLAVNGIILRNTAVPIACT